MDATGWVGLKSLEMGVLFLASLLLGLSPLLLPRLGQRYSQSSRVLRQVSLALARPASHCRLQLSQGLRCLTAGVLLASCLLDLLPDSARQIFNARRQLGLTSSFPLLEFFLSIGFLALLLAEQCMLAWVESTADPGEEEARLLQARARYSLPTLTDLAPQGAVTSSHDQSQPDTTNVDRNYGALLENHGGHVVCPTETTRAPEDPMARISAVDKLREAFRRHGVLMSRTLLFRKIFSRETDSADVEMVQVHSTTRNSCNEEVASEVETPEVISDRADLGRSSSSKNDVGVIEDACTNVQNLTDAVHCEGRDDTDGNIIEMLTAETDKNGIQTTSSHDSQYHHTRKESSGDLSTRAKTPSSSRSCFTDNESTKLDQDDKTEPATEQAEQPDRSPSPISLSVTPAPPEQPTTRCRHVGPSASQDSASERNEASAASSYSSITEQSSHGVLNSRGDNAHVQSALRSALLVAALCLHVFFEGLALTLTSTREQVFRFSVVLIFHRCMVSLSLGERLRVSQLSLTASVVCLVLFALASPLGLALAVGVGRWTSGGTEELVQGALLGMACGTVLYLVLFEILPFELLGQDGDRFVNLLCVVLGYSSMALLLLLSPQHIVCVV